MSKDKLDLLLKLPGKKSGLNLYPTLFHCFDTMLVAKEIINSYPENVKLWISESLGIKIEDLIPLLSFIIGLHDIGKLTPSFLHRIFGTTDDIPLNIKKYFSCDGSKPDYWHARSSQDILREEMCDVFDQYGENIYDFFNMIATLTGNHHGSSSPFESEKLQRGSGAEWKEVRKLFVNYIQDFSCIDFSTFKDNFSDEIPRKILIWILGFMVVCDWVASASININSNSPFDYRSYILDVPKRSKKISTFLCSNHLISNYKISTVDWETIIGYPLNELQKITKDFLEDGTITADCAVLVKGPTGYGKTETSHMIKYHFLKSGKVIGCYTAMPTQSSSNMLYKRENIFLNKIGVLDSNLIHGHAYLVDDFTKVVALLPKEARQWLTMKKVAMLQPHGVGTVDQLLFSILPVRHFSLRTFGIAHKVITYDEIHSYDSFTGALNLESISWSANTGCPTVLLSATMSDKLQYDIVSSYLGKHDIDKFSTGYGITVINRITGKITHKPLRLDKKDEKKISIDFISGKKSIDKIISSANNGGCVCVYKNTAKTAIITRKKIKKTLKKNNINDIEVYIIRNRFSPQKRQEIENDIDKKFGKNGQRPKKAIVISTQILEHSLDLDFDEIFTDLCPIDHLLQRGGRLHRFNIIRPLGKEKPRMNIILVSKNPVYLKYFCIKTELVLKDKNEIIIPTDVSSLINKVYNFSNHDTITNDKNQILELDKLQKKVEKSEKKDSRESTLQIIGKPSSLIDDAKEIILERNLYSINGKDIEKEIELGITQIPLTRKKSFSASLIYIFKINGKCYYDNLGKQEIDINDSELVKNLIEKCSISSIFAFEKIFEENKSIFKRISNSKKWETIWDDTCLQYYHLIVLENNESNIGCGKKVTFDPEVGVDIE
jgi:CRISPR-associated endonuclease/helicase Cas3